MLKLPPVAQTASEPTTCETTTTPNNNESEIFLKERAVIPANPAKNADLMMMDETIAGAGIPNIAELTIGEAIAVSKPTFQPYLYAAMSVKK